MKLQSLISEHLDDLMFRYYGGKHIEIIISIEHGEIEMGVYSIKHLQRVWRNTTKIPTPRFTKNRIHRKGYWYEFT